MSDTREMTFGQLIAQRQAMQRAQQRAQPLREQVVQEAAQRATEHAMRNIGQDVGYQDSETVAVKVWWDEADQCVRHTQIPLSEYLDLVSRPLVR